MNIIYLTSDEHRFLVVDALQAVQLEARVLHEPVARNTAAAMALAGLTAKPEDLLLFCPSDHHIPDAATFAQVVSKGVAQAQRIAEKSLLAGRFLRRKMTEHDELQAEIEALKVELSCLDTDCQKVQNA